MGANNNEVTTAGPAKTGGCPGVSLSLLAHYSPFPIPLRYSNTTHILRPFHSHRLDNISGPLQPPSISLSLHFCSPCNLCHTFILHLSPANISHVLVLFL